MSESIIIGTNGRGFVEVTERVAKVVQSAGVKDGLCTVFCHHTSASLILCENADPSVRRDLEAWMAREVEDGDRTFHHVAEGEDDMPAHLRSVLTGCSLGIPVAGGHLDLGTWQGIFLWEHRARPHQRRISVVVVAA
jgi:secondary thiamine-phosphate synthase enzyme